MAPHGYCLLWDPVLVWSSVASDALIAVAYFTIPAALIHIVRSRRDITFGWVFWAFAAFIIACGVSHLAHIWNLWHGDYAAEVAVKVVTASASIVTAAAIWRFVPQIIAIPSNADLMTANAELQLRISERDRAYAELERETAERLAAQSAAQELRLSRLSAMGAMAFTIAHELNQPLTASVNYLAVADQLLSAPGGSPDNVKAMIAKARDQGVRVAEIIRRMRAFTTRGEVSRLPESPEQLVRSALSSVQDRLRATGVELTLKLQADLAPVSVDRVQIEQVLTNVLRNAIEATLTERVRQIQCETVEVDGAVEFRVHDTGCGIPDGDTAAVFNLFNSSKQDGLGLGLPLCRTIVEAHGGKIWAENRDQGGATIVIALLQARADSIRVGTELASES